MDKQFTVSLRDIAGDKCNWTCWAETAKEARQRASWTFTDSTILRVT